MNRTAKVRQSLHCLADALEAVLTHAKIVGSLHRALAEACASRRFPSMATAVRGAAWRACQTITVGKVRRRGPKASAKAAEVSSMPPEWQEVAGLLPQLESAWDALQAALKAAEDLTRGEEGLERAVDLVAIQAALKAIGEHYGPHAYGFRLGLPKLREAKLIFTGRVPSEPPDGFLDGVRDLKKEAGKLRIKAPAAETIDTKADRLLSPLERKVWQAIPGKDGPRVTCASIAKKVRSTPSAVTMAISGIRSKLGSKALLSTKGNRSTFWRPDIEP